MNVFDRMVNNLQGFDEGRYFQNFIKANADFIIDQNQNRLEEFGTDAENKQLRTYSAWHGQVYASSTINMKIAEGQPYDRVTLKDTGDFYTKFKVVTKPDSFSVTADDNKPDGKISDNLDLESALGLYDLQPLINLYTTNLRKEVLSLLRK